MDIKGARILVIGGAGLMEEENIHFKLTTPF
jgi:hypothetical protein